MAFPNYECLNFDCQLCPWSILMKMTSNSEMLLEGLPGLPGRPLRFVQSLLSQIIPSHLKDLCFSHALFKCHSPKCHLGENSIIWKTSLQMTSAGCFCLCCPPVQSFENEFKMNIASFTTIGVSGFAWKHAGILCRSRLKSNMLKHGVPLLFLGSHRLTFCRSPNCQTCRLPLHLLSADLKIPDLKLWKVK